MKLGFGTSFLKFVYFILILLFINYFQGKI